MDPAQQGMSVAARLSMENPGSMGPSAPSAGVLAIPALRDVQAFQGFSATQANTMSKLWNPSPGLLKMFDVVHPNGLLARVFNGIKAVMPAGWDNIQKPEIAEMQITHSPISEAQIGGLSHNAPAGGFSSSGLSIE